MNQNFDYVKKVILIIFTCFAFLQAHPIGPFKAYSNDIWGAAFVVGLDGPMTPFTYDMYLPIEIDQIQENVSHRIYVERHTAANIQEIPFENLPLLSFRVPYHLFMDDYYNNEETEGVIYGLCQVLNYNYGPTESFLVKIENLNNDRINSFGFNLLLPCEA